MAFFLADRRGIINPLKKESEETFEALHLENKDRAYPKLSKISANLQKIIAAMRKAAADQSAPKIPLTLKISTEAINYLESTLVEIEADNDENNKLKDLLCHLHLWESNPMLPDTYKHALSTTKERLHTTISENYASLQKFISKSSFTIHSKKHSSSEPTKPAVSLPNFDTDGNFFRPPFIVDVMQRFHQYFDKLNEQQSQAKKVTLKFKLKGAIEEYSTSALTRLTIDKPKRALDFIVEKLQDASVENVKTLLNHFQYWMAQDYFPTDLKEFLSDFEYLIVSKIHQETGVVNMTPNHRGEIVDYRNRLIQFKDIIMSRKKSIIHDEDVLPYILLHELINGGDLVSLDDDQISKFWEPPRP